MCGSMQPRVLRHGWRSSYGSPIQPGLIDLLLIYRRTAGQHRLARFAAVVLVLAVLLLLLWVTLLRILRRALLLLLGCRSAAQIAHARLDLIHQADIFVIANHPRLRGIVRLLQPLRGHVHVLKIAEMQARNVRQHGNGKERHAERHRKAWRYHRREHGSDPGLQPVDPVLASWYDLRALFRDSAYGLGQNIVDQVLRWLDVLKPLHP